MAVSVAVDAAATKGGTGEHGLASRQLSVTAIRRYAGLVLGVMAAAALAAIGWLYYDLYVPRHGDLWRAVREGDAREVGRIMRTDPPAIEQVLGGGRDVRYPPGFDMRLLPPITPDHLHYTPVHQAILLREHGVVETMLGLGADANYRQSRGETILDWMIACEAAGVRDPLQWRALIDLMRRHGAKTTEALAAERSVR
jgi:hypothetical protein